MIVCTKHENTKNTTYIGGHIQKDNPSPLHIDGQIVDLTYDSSDEEDLMRSQDLFQQSGFCTDFSGVFPSDTVTSTDVEDPYGGTTELYSCSDETYYSSSSCSSALPNLLYSQLMPMFPPSS